MDKQPALPRQVQHVMPGVDADGVVHMYLSLRVGMHEISTWEPDRITALFDGIAKVIAASKGGA